MIISLVSELSEEVKTAKPLVDILNSTARLALAELSTYARSQDIQMKIDENVCTDEIRATIPIKVLADEIDIYNFC